MIEIKLIDTADQSYDLETGDKTITVRFRYNETAQRWAFDVTAEAEIILAGRLVVLGRNLINIPRLNLGMLFACDISSSDTEPNYEGLVSGKIRLYYGSPSDVAEAMATL